MALAEPLACRHCGTVMSMYADILQGAFQRRPATGGPPSVHDATWELLRCRRRLASTHPGNRLTGWAARAVAHQVAYDVALIELARCLGIACDPATFDRPVLRRKELDRQLAARGVAVDPVAGELRTPPISMARYPQS
jgi:hypothetical protein